MLTTMQRVPAAVRCGPAPSPAVVRTAAKPSALLSSLHASCTCGNNTRRRPQLALQAPPRRQRWVAAAAARKQQQKRPPQQQQQQQGKGFGGPAPSTQPTAPEPEAPAAAAPAAAAAGRPQQQPGPASAAPPGVLPEVGRGRIFAVCAQVSVLVSALAFGLRQVAPLVSPAVGDGQAATVEALLDCEC